MSHSSDFVDVLNDCWTRPNLYWTSRVTRSQNAVHNFARLKYSLEDHLTQDNKAFTKAMADNSEFASSLEAERADLVEAEKSVGGCCS